MRKAFALTAVLLLVLCSTALAAKFSGTAAGTPKPKVTFTVTGSTANGTFTNAKISKIMVAPVHYKCYFKTGVTDGGSVPPAYGFIEPAPIKSDGSFRAVYETMGQTPDGPLIIDQTIFRGKIVRDKKTGKFTASGTLRDRQSEAGIVFGYCGDKNFVPWTAKIGG